MVSSIRKRDARIVPFDVNKIAQAIFRAASSQGGKDYVLSLKIAAEVLERLNEQFEDAIPDVEQVQDLVEKTLIKSGHARTAKAYILYRAAATQRSARPNARPDGHLQATSPSRIAKDDDLKRENANIDARHRYGHDAALRQRKFQAVLRDVHPQPEAQPRRTRTATSTSTTLIS